MGANRALTAQVFDNLHANSSARNLWANLHARADNQCVFLLPGWIDAWHRSIGALQSLKVVVISFANQPVLAGSFVATNKQITFAGLGPTDYSQFLIAKDFSGEKLLTAAIDLLLDSARDAFPACSCLNALEN